MKLDTVIDDIVESYQKHNEISKVDTIRQPDKTIIIKDISGNAAVNPIKIIGNIEQ